MPLSSPFYASFSFAASAGLLAVSGQPRTRDIAFKPQRRDLSRCISSQWFDSCDRGRDSSPATLSFWYLSALPSPKIGPGTQGQVAYGGRHGPDCIRRRRKLCPQHARVSHRCHDNKKRRPLAVYSITKGCLFLRGDGIGRTKEMLEAGLVLIIGHPLLPLVLCLGGQHDLKIFCALRVSA
ncbi:hypothetical protein pqer_cds_381 [Pandoravirus quercus]|uniref:Uncharacterized protein n=1 Tax=Pandoravirus quercus TaxID=2107709 RepID=A0A2U7U8P5_9VIRU|nr:hypothetical protein pqer_cds_381 [Pandoravirus quercus]AVK74803.1 hypothetical protein pqer_cds_381 [Pandoravirus quercus]